MSRLFTDDRLRELSRPAESHAIDALHRGDMDALDRALTDMAQGHAGLDALSVHALARKAGKFRADLGEPAAREALERIGRQLMATWVADWRQGTRQSLRRGIGDLVAVFRHQVGAELEPLTEDDTHVTLCLRVCGSGGRVDRQKLAGRHPQAYGQWSDGVNSFCQGCKAQQRALNEAVGQAAWTTEKQADGACVLRFHKGASQGQALFDADEREAMTRTRVQEARLRLGRGDTDIGPLLDGQRKDWMPWHDFGVVWLAHCYAVALAHGGQAYLDEVLAQTYEPAFVAGFPHYASLDDEAMVREIARTWNYHCADFRLHEEDDRFVFTLDPCGSGGRLLRGQMWRDLFRYGRPLSPTIAQPDPINFMRREAPSYCTHCAASNRAQLSRAADPSVPLFFVIDGHAQSAPGMPCRTFVYKRQADRLRIDPALFHQLGLPGPSAPSGESA
ncbi:MAG: hypothetical protein R3E99_14275 [Burkholderiaceae bacterium]